MNRFRPVAHFHSLCTLREHNLFFSLVLHIALMDKYFYLCCLSHGIVLDRRIHVNTEMKIMDYLQMGEVADHVGSMHSCR